jgi:E3 ubiquitin-protein ligase DOA10
VAAVRNWHDAINHFEDYEDQNRFRIGRLLPTSELLVAGTIVLVFVGGFAAFIAALALTR